MENWAITGEIQILVMKTLWGHTADNDTAGTATLRSYIEKTLRPKKSL